MKKLFTLLAVCFGLVVMAPSTSMARDHGDHGHHHHSSSRCYSHACRSCGSSVYRERVYVGRDCHGHPQYAWRTASHRCRSSHGHGHHHHHHGSRGHISIGGFHVDF